MYPMQPSSNSGAAATAGFSQNLDMADINNAPKGDAEMLGDDAGGTVNDDM